MSGDFLTDDQIQNYGCYAANPNEVQLAKYFHLDERDLDFVNQRRGRHNRFGIALQLTTTRFLGTFLHDLMQIPDGVRFYVAAQLGISRYAQRDNTRWEHRALIRQHYGYHPSHPHISASSQWLNSSSPPLPSITATDNPIAELTGL